MSLVDWEGLYGRPAPKRRYFTRGCDQAFLIVEATDTPRVYRVVNVSGGPVAGKFINLGCLEAFWDER